MAPTFKKNKKNKKTISVDQCMEEFNFKGILENNLYILLELHRIDCVIHQKKDPKILLTKIIPTDSHLHTCTHKMEILNCIYSRTPAVPVRLWDGECGGKKQRSPSLSLLSSADVAQFFCLFPSLMRLNFKGEKWTAD